MSLYSNLKFNLDNLGSLILVEVAPYKKYVNKQATDDLEGYRYKVVCIDHAYEQLSVKIPKLTNFFPDFNPATDKNFFVEFIGLEIGVYMNFEQRNIGIKAVAEGVRALNVKNKGDK